MTESGLYERYVIYDKLLKIEKKKNNPQKALKYADSLLVLSDSMIARTIPEEMIEIQKKYNEEKLRAEKASLEVNLHLIANEKELILKEKDKELELYRKQESDLQIQKAKYEELCYVEFKKQFLSVPLSRKIPAFGIDKVVTEKLSIHSQEQLMSLMDEICYSFASRLYVLLQESTEKTCLCCLIRLEVKPRYIMILCDLSKEAYYK